MDNPNFGRFYLERIFQLPGHEEIVENTSFQNLSMMDRKLCKYFAFGSRNIRIKDLIRFFNLSMDNLKYYFWFRGIKKCQTFNYTIEEIEEFKDYLNWIHVLMYYKKLNNNFISKYQEQIINFLNKEIGFSELCLDKAIYYFMIQNQYLSLKMKMKIIDTSDDKFDKEFDNQLKIGIGKKISECNQFLFTSSYDAFYFVETMNQEMARVAIFDPGDFCIKLLPDRNIYFPYYDDISKLHEDKIIRKFFSPSPHFNRYFCKKILYKYYREVLSFVDTYINEVENRSVEDGWTPKIIEPVRGNFRMLSNHRTSLTYSNQYILDDYGIDDVCHDTDAVRKSFGIDHVRDKFLCNFSSGRDKFLERTILKFVSANRIQRWWKKIYFNPNHPVGKKVMERLWEEIKDLI